MDGPGRSRGKREFKEYLTVTAIVAAGVVLAYFTRDQRGFIGLILGTLSLLVATCYWHRRSPDKVALLVGVVPVVLVLGMALALTAMTKKAAVTVTKTADTSTETVSAGLVELFVGNGK